MTQDENILLETEGRTAGELLRMARERRGLSIEDIEDAVKIKARHVEAIEYDDHDELPGRVYAIGFIRAYAEYLGFDPDKMVDLFKMTAVGRHSSVDLSSHGQVVTVSQTPSAILVLVCVVALCFVGISFGQRQAEDSLVSGETLKEPSEDLVEALEQKVSIAYTEVESSLPEPVVTEKEEVEVSTPSAEVEAVANDEPDEVVKGVSIKAVYDSWIDVKDKNGKSVYSGILQMGHSYDVPDNSGYSLMTGNAGGTEVFVDGKSVGTLGKVSQVRKNIKLDSF
ncbi:MAG: helix-turn-helix domain-containing protein [Bdellovibrionales bacterium]